MMCIGGVVVLICEGGMEVGGQVKMWWCGGGRTSEDVKVVWRWEDK